MIGFPLRLLARENYDRVVKMQGRRAGRPDHRRGKDRSRRAPRYFVCTVESMPLDRPVEFLAVDEIQLAADPERGHVFTDRLLHARGTQRDHVARRRHHPAADAAACCPTSTSSARPRFSSSPMPGRRRRRGCRARSRRRRLLGRRGLRHRRADPPPARRHGDRDGRAQPAHAQRPGRACSSPARSTTWSRPTRSAWASTWTSTMSPSPALRKFDGRGTAPAARRRDRPDRRPRRPPHERRHLRHHRRCRRRSTPEIVEAIENHRFDPLRELQWRNNELDFRSVAGADRAR